MEIQPTEITNRRKLLFTDTTLRDGQQSLIATRMPIDEMLPILETMDGAGFHSMEVWGGATFDSCLRFLKEDPWQRLRRIKKTLKNTKVQMLFRGQNTLGYKMYPNEIINAFLAKSIENGVDIVRIFDALNDVRNVESSVKAVKKNGGHAQLAIAYTLSEVHTLEYFVKLAKQFESLGADSICIKDMAGLLLPYKAFELVTEIKKVTKLPIQIHSHCTSGLADMTYMKAVEAGADIVDTAISPFALGTSQPATEVILEALREQYDTNLSATHLREICEYFKPIREQALKTGLLDVKTLGVDIFTLLYQVPGGMLSNLISQLKMQNAEDKFQLVLEEIPRVRADFGYPPLVTPSSQIVGTQAVMNVMTGERYKIVPNETKAFVKGMYGRTPVPIGDDIKKKIIGDEKSIDVNINTISTPKLSDCEKEIKQYIEQDEDILTQALFPGIATEFFKYRQAQKYKIDTAQFDAGQSVYPV